MEVPLASDHFGHIGVNSCIRLARAMEKHNLAWMEDMVPWQLGDLMKQIKDATDIPILTGEDIYLKEDFIKLIDMGAVDMIHPDLASAGGLLETKKIGDYAMEHGVADGDALRRHADLVHGERALRGRHRELHRARAPLGRRAVVGGPRDRRPRSRSSSKGFAVAVRPARARRRARRGGREGAPQAGHAVLRAHARVEQERSWDRLWS